MFDKVSLNPDGWHARLQKWVFGYIPYESNFCPFFWLTIYCLMVTPFIGAYKVLKWCVLTCVVVPLALFEGAFDWFDKKYCIPAFERKVNTHVSTMSDDDALHLFKYMFYSITVYKQSGSCAETGQFTRIKNRERKKMYAFWDTWRARAGDDWETRLEAANDRRNEAIVRREEIRKQLKEENKAAEARRRKFYSELVKYTRILVYLPIGVVTIYLAYWIGMLGVVIIENWTGIVGLLSAIVSFIVAVGPWVLVILAALFLVVFAGYFLIKTYKKCSFSIPGSETVKKITTTIAVPFKSVWSFFVMYFKTFKENHCPSIEWDKEA